MSDEAIIRRNLTPWGSISPTKFMREMALHEPLNGDTFAQPRATLTVAYRREVQTRQWWTLAWVSENGQRRSVEASSLTLLMERAAAVELEVQRALEREWGEEMQDGWRDAVRS